MALQRLLERPRTAVRLFPAQPRGVDAVAGSGQEAGAAGPAPTQLNDMDEDDEQWADAQQPEPNFLEGEDWCPGGGDAKSVANSPICLGSGAGFD